MRLEIIGCATKYLDFMIYATFAKQIHYAQRPKIQQNQGVGDLGLTAL